MGKYLFSDLVDGFEIIAYARPGNIPGYFFFFYYVKLNIYLTRYRLINNVPMFRLRRIIDLPLQNELYERNTDNLFYFIF